MPRITIPVAGLGKLASSIVGGQSAYDQGMEEGATAQSKIAQALASIRANNASADLNTIKADAEREALNRQKPDAIRDNVLTRFGVPANEGAAVDSFLNTGKLGGKYEQVPDDLGGGPYLPQPSWAKDLGSIGQAIAGMNEAITLGDKSVENVAKAEGLRRNSRLSDAIIAGTADRNTVGGAQAAVDGKALFNSNEYGSMDNFTGKVDDSGAPAQRFGQYRTAQTGKEKELAGAAKANAVQSYASAAKTNQEREQGAKGVLQQTDQGLLLVNPRTGTATAVIGPDGKPAGAKPSNAANNISEGERKAATLLARLRGSQSQLLTVLGDKPGAAKPGPAAEFVRAIPIVGGDTPANLMTSESRQQVEAAQLDMLDAALTLGTGAAYTKEQLRGYAKSFFPQIGDGPKTVADKQVRLANVIRSAEIAAGRAESQVPKAPPPPKPGGASGGWGDGAAQDAPGWSITKVE
jgi:hypothetical protein